ncbi:MAG: PilZ domain-containing protein [Thermodesulfobacteriota bacterium]|nr:PilZ domain-containing protein [Thermodesulfobacteriota bacterium]
MKELKKGLQGLSRELTALRKKTDKIAAGIEKLERAAAPWQKGTKVARVSSKREAHARGHAGGRKTAVPTATAQVIHVINRAKKGVDVPTLTRKTGFEAQKVRNILARAFKEGRVTRIARGVYGPQKERRKHTRIHSLNLVSYVCMGEDKQVLRQAMGRTLDVTEGGMLLETHVPMEPKQTLLLTMGAKEDLVDVKGKVVHCRAGKGKRFQSGVRFTAMNRTSLQILKRFIAAFKKQQGED